MAKKTTYTITHRGFSFSRKSLRGYTHGVVAPESMAEAREREIRFARLAWRTNVEYYRQVAAGNDPVAAQYPAQHTQEECARRIVSAQAWLDKGEEGHVAEALARFDKYRAKLVLDADGDTHWGVLGFCGREDLARKLAAKRPGAVVVPVVVS